MTKDGKDEKKGEKGTFGTINRGGGKKRVFIIRACKRNSK